GEGRDLAIELLHLVAVLAAPADRLAKDALELFLQAADGLRDALLLGGREFLELLVRHHLALARRCEREPRRRAQQRDPLVLRLLDQLAESLLLQRSEVRLDLLDAGPELVALQDRRNR